MSWVSPTSLRVLHAVRLLGHADSLAIAARAGAGHDRSVEVLRDAERRGWVRHLAFAGDGGWSLTEEGRAENERQLTHERGIADPGNVVDAVHRDFLPLNARLLRAVTDWQLKPADGDRLAPNTHDDGAWDDRVLAELAALSTALVPLAGRLTATLARFGGYDDRFEAALRRARAGHHDWVDRTGIDSCHRVWFQLHEDLVATLGIDRGGS
ncbi:transcriptional regulator [Myceligenerans pegani]|uniref:Transcriptional regulator n=1 Tax=Myceligenerans pegani TaxID=2776917 RepID=A0ABR9N1R4_9MICO|nr:transcriptional regulator [Myceligenerans sp. TRM 65318]MBE1877590.1 transcriptional regulator [Myceligenerans sp. TRM 65318]MBE3019861.1 transcriptional regulator [Myceligenerans sp. TRM 65318]